MSLNTITIHCVEKGEDKLKYVRSKLVELSLALKKQLRLKFSYEEFKLGQILRIVG